MNKTIDTVACLLVTSAVMGVLVSPAGQVAIASSLAFRASWAAALAASAVYDVVVETRRQIKSA
jgi:hypothetical protein